eukprot:Gb_25811 [translate_table: standard]
MSSSHHGKEKRTSTAKQSILSYFNKPHLKTAALHDIGSSSSKQPTLEHDFNGSRVVGSSSTLDSHGNSSGLEIGYESLTRDDLSDGPTKSSHDHPREKNDLSPKFRESNPTIFPLDDEPINSRKRKKGQWDIGRCFQPDWVSKFPFIELVPSENEKNTSKEVRWCINNARPTEWPLCKVTIINLTTYA